MQGEAVRLDPRLLRWAASRSCGDGRRQRWSHYESSAPRRIGYGMNWPISVRRHRAVVLARRAASSACADPRRNRVDARRRIPAALRLQLRRAAHERQRDPRALRQSLGGAADAGLTSRSRSRSICSRDAAPASARNLCMARRARSGATSAPRTPRRCPGQRRPATSRCGPHRCVHFDRVR